MRQFDTYQSYLDNIGGPLVGRVRFCKLDGSSASIYDSDGNPLTNPILTDSSGRTAVQVFLDDHDYLVFFEKYVGSKVMAEVEYDDDNGDDWEEMGSAINRYNTVGINVDSDGGIMAVGTMSELKNLDPRLSSYYVMLLGYESLGDKPAVSYVWKESCKKSSDGGSVVSSNIAELSNGKWVMVPSFSSVDVRHFGAFPSETEKADVYQRYAIQMAEKYAASLGIGIYFHADKTSFIYDVDGLNLDKVDCSSNVRLYNFGQSDTVLTNTVAAYVVCLPEQDSSTKIYVRGSELRTSFDVKRSSNVVLEPSEKLIFDTDYIREYPLSLSGIECILLVNQSSNRSTFAKCTFSGNSVFAANTILTFKDCEIRESMFEDFDPGYVNTESCYTTINLWESVEKYISYKVDNGETDIDLYNKSANCDIDCEGKDLSIRNGKIVGDIRCSNFYGSNVSIEGNVNCVEFSGNRVSVSGKSEGVANRIVYTRKCSLESCEVNVAGHLFEFYATNSVVNYVGDVYVSYMVDVSGCTFKRPEGSYSFFISPYSALNRNIKDVRIKDCKIAGWIKFNAIPYGEESGVSGIYVDGLELLDNRLEFTFDFYEWNEPASNDGYYVRNSKDYFAKTLGEYRIRGNYLDNGRRVVSTVIDHPSYEFDEKWPYDMDMSNKEIHTKYEDGTPVLCLSNFVWSFGEDKNMVDYGTDKLAFTDLVMYWNGKDYYGSSKNGKWNLQDSEYPEEGVLVVTFRDGIQNYANLKENFFPADIIKKTGGDFPEAGWKYLEKHVKASFRPWHEADVYRYQNNDNAYNHI